MPCTANVLAAYGPFPTPISLFCLIALLVVPTGCNDAPKQKENANAVTPSAASGSASAAVAPNPPSVDTAGKWRGHFESEQETTEVPKPHAQRAWRKSDDGIGKGEIELSVSASGELSGAVTGALGALRLQGEADATSLRARLSPAPGDDGFAGWLLLTAKDSALSGDLRVSHSKSGQLRRSRLLLERVVSP